MIQGSPQLTTGGKMKTTTGPVEKRGKGTVTKPRLGGTGKYCAALVMFVIACFLVIFVTDRNSHATSENSPSTGSVTAALTATSCVLASNRITPGSLFTVKVLLQANSELQNVELRVSIPVDWSVFSLDHEGAKVHALEPDFSKFQWTWASLSAGEKKKVFYQVTVPAFAEAGNYLISSKIIFPDGAEITVDGEESVDVKKPAPGPAESIIPLKLLVGIALIIFLTFMILVILGWWKDKSLDKGEIRRAVAGTLVVGFTILTMLSISFGIYQKEIVLMYVQLAGVVVAFYFGARIAKENGRLATAEKPIVRNIIPSKGKGVVPVAIEGKNFAPDSQIRLRQSGQDDIPVPVEEKDFSSTKMNCVFDLTGKTGTWKVIVVNPDKKESEPVLFTVEE